jgi:FixJ family two-component response regulator
VVAIVDDDDGMRHAMRRVLETEGFATELFGTAEAFLASGAASRAECLVLDIHLPGMSGFELHGRLRAMGHELPTVFVTAHAAKETANCLIKPFPAETLIRAVHESIAPEAKDGKEGKA